MEGRMFKPLATNILIFLLLFAACVMAADQESRYADFLSSLENYDKKDFKDILVAEIEHYLRVHPAAPGVNEVHFKMATVYTDTGDDINSFYSNLEILFLYPGTRVDQLAQDRVRTLLTRDRKFKEISSLSGVLTNPATMGFSPEDAYYRFLKEMVDLNFSRTYAQLANSCDRFLTIFPNSVKADEVRMWRGDALKDNKDYREALSEYMKVTYLHEQSVYVTASKLRMAEVLTEELGMHDNAVTTLEEFLLEYPQDPQASQAQYRIGGILEKEKKRYLEAINAYSAVAQKYPASVEAVPGLFDAARLYEERFKEYDQAIRVYTEVVRDFPQDEKAPYALAESARIYEKRVKDPFNAVNAYVKVYNSYPNSSIAPDCLFAAADISENDLKNNEKAAMYYDFLVQKYPTSKLAKDARKRLEQLQKELAEQIPSEVANQNQN